MNGNSKFPSSLTQFYRAKIIQKVALASVRDIINLPPGKNAAPSSNGLGPLERKRVKLNIRILLQLRLF